MEDASMSLSTGDSASEDSNCWMGSFRFVDMSIVTRVKKELEE